MIYEYNLTDHLGNTRITFGDADADGAPDILQENHYYPFGMAMTMSSTPTAAPPNDYLYNGKELQTELGLDWYDYGARMYDASIGRWNGVEALAEKYVAWSPFNYTLSNPIRFVDPDGNSAVDWKDNGDGTYTAEKGDGAYTLARDAGITLAEAKKSIEESGFELYLDVDGIEKVGIDPGAVVTVENFNSEEEYQPEDESDVQGYPSFDEWQRENRTENDILVAGMEGAGTGVAAYVLGNWGRGLKLPKLNGGEVAAGFVIGSWLEMGSQLREWSESLTPDQREARESNRARAIEMIIEYKGDYGE